jgi:HEAT repeat protein
MPLFGQNVDGMKSRQDIAGLTAALYDKSPSVRSQAAQALGSLRNESAVEALVEAAARSRERERTAVDKALASPDPKHSANFYINRIASEEYTLRTTIVQALGTIGRERAIRALFEMLDEETGQMEGSLRQDIQTTAADTLQRDGDRSIPLLCELLGHQSVAAREWAAHCLGSFSGSQAIVALITAAYDEDEHFDVREASLYSLAKMGDRRVIPYLEDLQHSGNRSIVRDAQAALAGIRQRFPLSHQTE